jgi:hypothetical protein
MISIELAQRLHQAGLHWAPAERDTFAVPSGPLENQVFVISQLTALIQLYNNNLVVAFHGSSEWALDYVLLTEVIWLPSETQLRNELAQRIGDDAPLRLDRTSTGYRCRIADLEHMRDFDAPDAESAYALALLHMLGRNERRTTNDK